MPYCKVNRHNIYYEIKGNPEGKAAVAFLNGVMASTGSWSNQVPLFERFDFKILLHDFKGQLRSEKPEGPYTFEEHAHDLKTLLENLGIRKVHLIGTSYGGEVAMVFGINYPEVVKSISIIDSVSEIDPLLHQSIKLWITLVERNTPEDFYWGVIPTLYGNRFIGKNMPFLQERASHMTELPPDYFQGQRHLYETFLTLNISAHIHKIRCPALVICGQDDLLKPVKFSRLIAEKIPQSEFVILPDCAHVSIYEKPKELNSLLLGFILKNC